MFKIKSSLIPFAGLWFLIGCLLLVTPSAVQGQALHKLTTPVGGIAFEVVGQVINFPPAGTQRVISNGRLRIVNRTGTTTIYFDETPSGDFTNRDTFRSGTPVMTMVYRQQVILDVGEMAAGLPGTGTFTVMNLLRVSEAQTFEIEGERYQLGKPGDQFRQFYSGAPPAAIPPIGVFAGYAVAIEPDNGKKIAQPQ